MLLDVTSHMEYDPKWSWTDKHGHKHIENKDAKKGDRLFPSLKFVVDAEETDEYPASVHYECSQCGERLPGGSPGTKPTQHKQYVVVRGL